MTDPTIDIVPSYEREPTVERTVTVRQDVPRCAAKTAAGRQCASSGTPTDVDHVTSSRRFVAVPLCKQHRAMIGRA